MKKHTRDVSLASQRNLKKPSVRERGAPGGLNESPRCGDEAGLAQTRKKRGSAPRGKGRRREKGATWVPFEDHGGREVAGLAGPARPWALA